MPPATAIADGAPVWLDVFSTDPDRMVAFYEALFGWTSERNPDFGGYITFSKDGVPIAGGMANDGADDTPDCWNVYLKVADAEAAFVRATERGATPIVPPMPVGELGSMAVLADCGGAAVGMWQPGTHVGFGTVGEPGTPNWFELHTRDYDRSVAFYTEVFGWQPATMSDVPEFRYTTDAAGPAAAAGVMDAAGFLPEGVPAHWSVYFGVADTDRAVARVVELGGTLLAPPEDTPFGRLATVADPTGATFKVVEPPPEGN